MAENSDHVVLDFKAKALTCRNCGASEPLEMPISVSVLVDRTNAYLERHESCAPTREATR